jgi:G3E family GTPase
MSIPVFVLSGFLGSGKTTLLLRLLEEAKSIGLRPGVLMNELGKQDVDGSILDEHTGAKVEKLLDGCVCCSKKEELAGALNLLVRQKPDLILIELTGVANPEEIADALTEPGLTNLVKLKQVITLLDAENFQDYNSIFTLDKQLLHTLRRQIEVADLIVVNKTDLVKPSELSKIEKAVRKQNEKASVIYTEHSRIDIASLLSGIKPAVGSAAAASSFKALKTVRTAAAEHKHHEHGASASFSRIQTATLPWHPKSALSRREIEKFMHRWNNRLLRAKGYISVPGKEAMVLMQHAGNRTYWQSSSYSGDPYVVFIGLDLNVEQLTAEWVQLLG